MTDGTKYKFVVRQDETQYFLVIRQKGLARDDSKDETIALCPSKYHATRIARLLQEYEND